MQEAQAMCKPSMSGHRLASVCCLAAAAYGLLGVGTWSQAASLPHTTESCLRCN